MKTWARCNSREPRDFFRYHNGLPWKFIEAASGNSQAMTAIVDFSSSNDARDGGAKDTAFTAKAEPFFPRTSLEIKNDAHEIIRENNTEHNHSRNCTCSRIEASMLNRCPIPGYSTAHPHAPRIKLPYSNA